ncbi:MAG: AAA family ATPase [Solirubrobacterales bacterium]|nr:AAA family ATPase [Solirubrobacterales bacterium]
MEALTSEQRGIVGRRRELEAIGRMLDSLGAADPCFAEFVGEPGIGKTTLLRALADEAENRGHLVLRGRASQFELETPFDPFVDALDDYLRTINPRRFEALGAERLGELATAFPAMLDLDGVEAARISSEERYRIHRAVRELLRLLGDLKPLVLVLDDAQWSDQASLELLHHLLRRPPPGPVMVAIAHRTGTMPDGWRAIADAAVREGDLTRLEVGPLAREEAEELLIDQVADGAIRAKVFQAAGGNPFFMRQVAAAAHVITEKNASMPGREGVPRAVLAAIREELDSLAEPEREALQAAAVAGDPFDPALAAVAASFAEAELLPRLDALRQRGLIRPGRSPREFQFRHPLVWRGVHEGAPAGWRVEAHRRLAEHLAAQGAPAATRAPHVEAAAGPGDLEAARILREAAETSLARAPASAAHWFAAALRLLPETEDVAQERIALLVLAATALGSTGRLEECRDRLQELLGLIPTEAAAERVMAVIGCATMESLLRNQADATRMLATELDSLRDPASREAAAVLLALTTLHVFDDSQREPARKWGRRALELGAREGWRLVEGEAAAALAMHELRLANVAVGEHLLDRAREIVDATEHTAAASGSDPALFWLGAAEMHFERFDDAVRHGKRAWAMGSASGQGRWLPMLAASVGWSLWQLGRLEEAGAALQEAVEMAEVTGNRQAGVLGLCAVGLVSAEAGRIGEAVAAGERVMDLAGPVTEGENISLYARENAAPALLAAGDSAGARQLVHEAMDARGYSRQEPIWQFIGLDALVEAELRLGDVDAAERYARRGIEVAEALGLAMRRSVALRGWASVRLARDEAGAAAAAAREAAESAAIARARVQEGRALTVVGKGLVAAGEREPGTTELGRAYRLLDDCGAAHWRDQAARELRKLGVRVARPGRRGVGEAGVEALSAREREIAQLVADGMTNKQIAATLYISPKTVEGHLGSVFRKLGVSKRAAVGLKLG